MLFTSVSSAAVAASFLLSASSALGAQVEGTCLPLDTAGFLNGNALSPNATISCNGSPGQISNFERYWGRQAARDSQVVVQPTTAQDVATIVGLINEHAPELDWTFVGGGHSQINGSSSSGLVIDLNRMNKIEVIPKYKIYDGSTVEVVSFEGGVTTAQVLDTLATTGRSIITARMRTVGMGGFTTGGGGIGFLSVAKGYAGDNIVAMEVVTPTGKLVTATPKNSYSDLFYAINGGNGQFGTVTKFFVRSWPTPSRNQLASVYVADADLPRIYSNIVSWYKNNKDPYSLVYFAVIYSPGGIAADPTAYSIRHVATMFRMQDDSNPAQANFNTTFAPLIAGLDNSTPSAPADVPFGSLTAALDPAFPYGFRRGIYGPQIHEPTVKYIKDATATLTAYVNAALGRGELPATACWALQYTKPLVPGALPKTAEATAWPHNVVGYQTLFSPAQSRPENDDLIFDYTGKLNALVYQLQKDQGVVIKDYPNYISPKQSKGISKVVGGVLGWNGAQVWGGNLAKLAAIKEKYDPRCILNKGYVFSSKTCKSKGKANVF